MPRPVRRRVVYCGRLSGQGHEADCEVSAIAVPEPGGGITAYAKYSVQKVSKQLPEGSYQLLLPSGETQRWRHQSGHWLSGEFG
jgi:hypothetical protein